MFGTSFDNWQAFPPPATHNSCSPNLLCILIDLQNRWPGLTNLGCFQQRPVRGGTAPSSHWFGAALDVGFPPGMNTVIRDQVCPFLVARSLELNLQAIHDYRRSRIWRAGRTPNEADACSAWWRIQRGSSITGMGQAWCNHLHLEVTASGWAYDTPVEYRWDE